MSEIKETKFNELMHTAHNLPNVMHVLGNGKVMGFLKGILPVINEDEVSRIYNHLSFTNKKALSILVTDFLIEIEYNKKHIRGNDQYKRYLDSTHEMLSLAHLKIGDKIALEQIIDQDGNDVMELFAHYFKPLNYLKQIQNDKQEIAYYTSGDITKPFYITDKFSRQEEIAYFLIFDLLSKGISVYSEYQVAISHVEKELIRNNFVKIPGNKTTQIQETNKIVLNTLKDAMVDEQKYNEMCMILLNKGIINEDHVLIKTATVLYGIIKRLKKMGFFRAIIYEDLHPLVNAAFNTNTTLDLFKQAKIYDKAME